MNSTKRYENFPPGIVLLCSSVPITIYVIGILILAGFGVGVVALYLIICLGLEYRSLKVGCVNCFYYGKWCGFGKGKLCSLLFKKGDPQRFIERTVSWRDVLPDFLVFLLPTVGGIILLVQDFEWSLLIALAVLVMLSFGGTAFVRKSFSCRYCKQKDIGCPAEQLFRGARET
jgi:hypothetical protein